MVGGESAVGDGRRKPLTDKMQGGGRTTAPAKKKQARRPGARPPPTTTREARRQGPRDMTPQHQTDMAKEARWTEPSPVWTNLSGGPRASLSSLRSPMTPARVSAKRPKRLASNSFRKAILQPHWPTAGSSTHNRLSGTEAVTRGCSVAEGIKPLSLFCPSSDTRLHLETPLQSLGSRTPGFTITKAV